MIDNDTDNGNRTKQKIFDICKSRFGIVTDPRYSTTTNANHLIATTDPTELPRKPKNLKCWNLCENKAAISPELLNTLGLNLTFGISMKPKKNKTPIDFNRLRRAIRLCFVPFPPKNKEEHYDPKLHSKSDWEPPKASKHVETAMDSYEASVDTAFQNSWKKEHIVNLKEKKIDLLKRIKKERKYIVIATDKTWVRQ